MSLYLVRHGKSYFKEEDAERSLTREGIEEVKRIADESKRHQIRISRIIHSGKKRAQQTAELFAAALDPPHGVAARKGLDPLDDVKPIARDLSADEHVMLVGHLPFLEKLVSHLVVGSTKKSVV